MATGHAFHAEPRPLQRPVARDRFEGVVRAAGSEPALGEHEVRERQLVAPDQTHHDNPGPATHVHVTCLTTSVSSARRTANGASYAERLERTTRSTRRRTPTASRRNTSRSRRRTPLRATPLNCH